MTAVLVLQKSSFRFLLKELLFN